MSQESNTPVSVEEQAENAQEHALDTYTDGYAYEVPRPFLTLQQAAAVLGKSLRSLERSLLGRWGNKLPDGWVARKLRTENGDEWRILPPPGFRVRQLTTSADDTAGGAEYPPDAYNYPAEASRRRQLWRAERHTLDQPSIVIDRSQEVEHLLRDLVASQRALSEERRLHMEDLRMITQLQGSMRLLESSTADHHRVKVELESTKNELDKLKEQYNQLISLPWWKRMFRGGQS